MKIKYIFVLVFCMWLGVANAASPQIANKQPAAQQPSPDALLKEGIYNIIGFLRQSGATDLNKILYFIDRNISHYFDFDHMTKLAAGAYGQQLTAAQMNNLSNKIRTLFIESLSSNLVDYAFTNREVRFFPPQRTQYGNEVTLHAIITHPRGFPSRMSFRFHPTKNGWKIYDLAANGQSAVLYYRHKVSRMVARGGITALTQ